MTPSTAYEVVEADAGGRVADLFEQVRHALGTTFVPTVYRRMATHPAALAAAVAPLGSIVHLARQENFARRSQRLAAGLLAVDPSLQTLTPRGPRSVVERYRAANPLNLVFAVAVLGLGPAPRPVMAPPLGPPHADEDEDIEACHGGVVLPGLWRELAPWAPWRSAAWSVLRAEAEAGHLRTAREEVLAAAADLVSRSPVGAAHKEVLPLLPPAVAAELRGFPAVIASMVVEAEWLVRAMDNDTEE
jgi:hypothetical protein